MMKKRLILPLIAAFSLSCTVANANIPPFAPQVGQTVAMLNEHLLKEYVINYESFDWNTVQDAYNKTIAMSDKSVADMFRKIYASDNAPHKVLKMNYKVVVSVQSIDFAENQAKVHFSKQVVSLADSSISSKRNLIATIEYDFLHKPQDKEESLLNPLGFNVKSYQVEKE